jgi:four helix bundle protein
MTFKFENLKVWQDSVELSGTINDVCKKFPANELYVLTSQLKRAADSISLNIAEGSTGQTNPEFKRFLGIAIRSGIEVIACIHLAKKRNIISDDDFTIVYQGIDLLVKKIQDCVTLLTNKLWTVDCRPWTNHDHNNKFTLKWP